MVVRSLERCGGAGGHFTNGYSVGEVDRDDVKQIDVRPVIQWLVLAAIRQRLLAAQAVSRYTMYQALASVFLDTLASGDRLVNARGTAFPRRRLQDCNRHGMS